MEEQPKKKRVMTRIGDIFCVLQKDYKVYFQFIAIDSAMLGGPVIRVFSKKHPLDYEFCAEEVVKGEVWFYAHTVLQPGLKGGYWTKVGKSKELGEMDHILFRSTFWDKDHLKSYRWWVAGISKKPVMIGELTEEYKEKTHFGAIFCPASIIHKILYGEYSGPQPY